MCGLSRDDRRGDNPGDSRSRGYPPTTQDVARSDREQADRERQK